MFLYKIFFWGPGSAPQKTCQKIFFLLSGKCFFEKNKFYFLLLQRDGIFFLIFKDGFGFSQSSANNMSMCFAFPTT
jgi:hypothetical protein